MKLLVSPQSHRADGATTFTGATPLPLVKVESTSSANTTFTDRTVTDASAWTLTNVEASDMAVTSDGWMGVVITAATNVVTVRAWVKENCEGIPVAGSTVSIYKIVYAKTLLLHAEIDNSADVYIGRNGIASASNFYLSPGDSICLIPDGDEKYLDCTKIYGLVASGTQKILWGQGAV